MNKNTRIINIERGVWYFEMPPKHTAAMG